MIRIHPRTGEIRQLTGDPEKDAELTKIYDMMDEGDREHARAMQMLADAWRQRHESFGAKLRRWILGF